MPATASHPPARGELLRREVGRFRARESRRVFDTAVHVGELGGPSAGFVVRAQDVPAMDDALRIDVVAGLLDGSPDTWRTTWVLRPGTPEPHDLDLRWFAAARTAFGMHDRPLEGCFVLTRTGWRDLGTDESRVWKRLRLRSSSAVQG